MDSYQFGKFVEIERNRLSNLSTDSFALILGVYEYQLDFIIRGEKEPNLHFIKKFLVEIFPREKLREFISKYLNSPWMDKKLSGEEKMDNLFFKFIMSEEQKTREKFWNKFINVPYGFSVNSIGYELTHRDFRDLLVALWGEEDLNVYWQEKVFYEACEGLNSNIADHRKIDLLRFISSVRTLKNISNNWNFSKMIMEEVIKRLLLKKGLTREAGIKIVDKAQNKI